MNLERILIAAALLGACTPTTTPPPTEPAPSATSNCAADEFAACPDGEHCARRGSAFIRHVSCHQQAAAACDEAACAFGCDVYHTEIGGPKLVLCAPNASSSGHMQVCGGIANWGCPERMTCEFPPEAAHTLDASGRCVRSES